MRYSLIIVDDVPVNIMILQSILESDYDIITATSGAEALEIMSVPPYPSLALLDISMPEMDGFELFEHMKNNNINVPVIFLTGEKDAYSEEKGLSMGAVDYIKKPYLPGVITRKISNQLDIKASRNDFEPTGASPVNPVEFHAEELVASNSAFVLGMSLLAGSRSQISGSRIIRFKSLVKLMAEQFALQYPELLSWQCASAIANYSPLHDVGNISIPDYVLKKQGGLTKEEFEQMKAHTLYGGDLLRQVAAMLPKHDQDDIKTAIEIVEGHHERYDGSGYPLGLAGDTIPLSARIVMLVDIYFYLRTNRPYKPGLTHKEAVGAILRGNGCTNPGHFDPLILKLFEDINENLRIAYELDMGI